MKCLLAFFAVLFLAGCVYSGQQLWRRKHKKYEIDEDYREFLGKWR
ncbi:MAG: hypothetical protein KKD18_02815 [Nanoarchaeota archaeon]|nr:hypothetical protein [Nanoarchaeota archaeon]